jgi:GPH family glycoside/pentoside/hexuronide:cation symporter
MRFSLKIMVNTTNDNHNQSATLSWGRRIGYGSGDFALNLFWQGTAFFLMFFYTNVVGLPNKTAGLIIMIGGIWDAFSDPLMGYLAERTRSRWGAYRPYLLFGALPLALSFTLIFWVPSGLEGSTLTAFTLITLLVFKSCYTLVSIPYSTLGARVTSDSRERTKLMGVRMMAGFAGGMVVTGLAAYFRGNYNAETAFSMLGIACTLVSIGALYYCFKSTDTAARRPTGAPPAENIKEALQALMHNKAFMLILGAIILVAVANVFINSTVLYYFSDAIGSEEAGNRALVLMTATPLIAIPIWSMIALRFDKKNSWILGSAVVIAGCGLLYMDESNAIPSAYFTYVLLNFGLSSYAVLFWSMLPDTIEYGEYATGVRNESTIIGVVSSGQKISLALSAYVLGHLLDGVGYQPGAEQPETAIEGLKLMIAGVPALALAASALMIAFYPITAAKHQEILRKLDKLHK